MTAEETHYRVSYGRIKMPEGLDGRYYIRRVCKDGAVTFLPVAPIPVITEDSKNNDAVQQQPSQEAPDQDPPGNPLPAREVQRRQRLPGPVDESRQPDQAV